MQKSIVVPLDGSPFGATALPMAASLARRVGAEVHLIHVHPQPVVLHGAPANDLQFDVEMEQQMGGELQEAAETLRAETGLPVTATLLEGSTEEALLERITSEHPWLVVMSSHGYGGLRRMWHGSVADALVRHAAVPVLVVPPVTEIPPHGAAVDVPAFQDILLPLDGSAMAEEIVAFAATLAEPGHASFTLLRIVEPTALFVTPEPAPAMALDDREIKRLEREALAQFARASFTLKSQGFVTLPQVVVRPQPAQAILAFAAEHRTDLIALSTHGYGGFKRAVLGSVADHIMRHANVAVLLRGPARDSV